MSRTVFRYVVSLYARYLVAIFLIVLVVFMVADLSDRAKMVLTHLWADVYRLYWNKALVAAQQLAPAALLLAAGACVSTLRKRGELTALKALSFSPSALYLPIGLCALVGAVALVGFDEWVVTRAGARVDQISMHNFNAWGDLPLYYRPKQWFRKGDRIFFLRGALPDGQGYSDVTILSLTPEFQLVKRIDARALSPVGDTRWHLSESVERTFSEQGGTTVRSVPDQILDLGVRASAFQIHQGRPEQMRLKELRQQIVARRSVGLPTQTYVLALHNRFAYPLTGFAAALLAVGLALRPQRRGHLTVALVEGFAISIGLWGMMVIGKALVIGEHLAAPSAAWGPFAVLLAVATSLWLRREGKLGWSGA